MLTLVASGHSIAVLPTMTWPLLGPDYIVLSGNHVDG